MRPLKTINGLITSSVLALGLLSCSSEKPVTHDYASPIITGQVLNKITHEPIANVSISQTSKDGATTDHDGYFKLPAYKVTYTASDNGRGLQLMSEGSFLYYKEGYKRKYYWNSGLKFLEIKHTEEVPYHIHLGKVFLEPLPEGVGINDVEDDVVENMTFCKPRESQKEVNCMPLPDGVTNETL